MSDSRDVSYKRESAEDALTMYAEALRDWNAPDDAHTRLTLRTMVEDIIAGCLPVTQEEGK